MTSASRPQVKTGQKNKPLACGPGAGYLKIVAISLWSEFQKTMPLLEDCMIKIALCLTAVWSKLVSQTGRSAFGWALGFGIARWAYRCVAQPLRLRRGDISGDGNKRYAEHTASTGTHSE